MSKKAEAALITDKEALVGALSGLIGQVQSQKQKEYWKHTDADITYSGTKITLPDDPVPMSNQDAIAALERKEEADNQFMDTVEIIEAFPLDGAVAFTKALRFLYGWANAIPTPGFFGPENPKMITVETGLGESVQVPWGRFQVPGIEKPISVGAKRGEYGPVFLIKGEVRKKEQHVIKRLAECTREILTEESIYQGKTVRLRVDSDGDIDFEKAPQFIDTDSAKPEELIMNRNIEDQIETSILTPIKHTKSCIENSIPLNRGVLLEGPYGTGKTMTAMLTGKACQENGWTFILLDDVKGLKEALLFAQRYQPAVVFAEDIDRVAGERDEKGNDLLNTIDGALTKSAKVITCLTTNYVEKIHHAMLRPGRLDAVISVTQPDAEAVGRLIQLYARDLLKDGETLNEVGEILQGEIPATIREVVERSKLGMISRGATTITENDLVVAAKGMRRHLELLNSDEDDKPSLEEAFGIAARDLLQGKDIIGEISGVKSVVKNQSILTRDTVEEESGDIQDRQNRINRNTKEVARQVDEIHRSVVS